MLTRARFWTIFGWLSFLLSILAIVYYQQQSQVLGTYTPPDPYTGRAGYTIPHDMSLALIFLVISLFSLVLCILLSWRNNAGYRQQLYHEEIIEIMERQIVALEYLAGKKQAAQANAIQPLQSRTSKVS